MTKTAKRAIALGAVVVVAGAAVAFAVTGSDVTTVEIADVTREDLGISVIASGEVEADRQTDVYPPTAGTIASVEVTEGARVEAGQVLAMMDTAPLEVQVAQAEAAYQGAVAQRDAIGASTPGPSDLKAAEAAVNAAYSAYEAANAGYEAAVSGLGASTSSELATAELMLAVAETASDAAHAAYDAYHENVYLPAPEPRDAVMESTLDALEAARDEADKALADAQATVAAIESAASAANTTSAKVARDQAYAAYLGAVAQRDALVRASDASGARASADAAVTAAEAALEYAGDTLEQARIVAPVDGIVLLGGSSAASLIPGAASSTGGGVSEGSSVSPAAPVFEIVSFDALALNARVDEADIGRIESGMKATVTLDGVSAREFAAKVTGTGTRPVTTATGGTAFPVKLVFETMGENVLLGMNGSAEIEVDTIEEALTIPVEALFEEDGVSFVFRYEDEHAYRAEIEVGRMTDTRVEVLSGLDETDRVIVSGASDLVDGARVRAE